MDILPGYIKQGKQIIWMAAGGDYAITLASIANGAARQGVVGDLSMKNELIGARGLYVPRYAVELQINMDVIPVAGTTVELWAACSHNGTTFPGGVAGTDAAWTGDGTGTVAQCKVALTLIGALPLSPVADAVVQRIHFVFEPPARYLSPVVVNLGGQALEGDDDSHRITFTPLIKMGP